VAKARDVPFDVALSLHALARCSDPDSPAAKDLLAESQEILDKLGVLSVR
jgi:hypothetical protein